MNGCFSLVAVIQKSFDTLHVSYFVYSCHRFGSVQLFRRGMAGEILRCFFFFEPCTERYRRSVRDANRLIIFLLFH